MSGGRRGDGPPMVVFVGLVCAGVGAFLARPPFEIILFAGVAAFLSSLIFFRQSRDVAKKVCLSLSAVGFKRLYGVGGVAAAISVALSLNSSIPLGDDSWWGWAAVEWLFSDTLDKIILLALAAPIVAAFVSEMAFGLILKFAKLEAVPSIVAVTTERTEETADVERPKAGDVFSSSNREHRTTTKLRRLIPVEFRPGGLKQVVRSFLTATFRSSFFGYAPYSALVAEDRYDPHDGRRIGILAKAGDAVDFEWIEWKEFQVKRVTDSCWILVRKPLHPEEVERVQAERREERRRKAENRPSSPGTPPKPP